MSPVPTPDPVLYRDAMSRLAGHVQIVTTSDESERRGVTITAACSVSDNPATVLVCLNAANPRNGIFLRTGCFALNVLGANQLDLANVFSGRDSIDPQSRFSNGDWSTIETGAPTLATALAVFDCRVIDVKTIATHMVLFGEVVGIQMNDARDGLVYFRRDYKIV